MKKRQPHLMMFSTLIALGLTLTACGHEQVSDDTATSDANSSGSSQSASGADDEQRTDTSDQRAVEWERYETVNDDTVRVFYLGGTEECYGYHAQTTESNDEVHIAIVEGYLSDAPEACPDLGREASMLVKLDAPLGDRTVVALENPRLAD